MIPAHAVAELSCLSSPVRRPIVTFQGQCTYVLDALAFAS